MILVFGATGTTGGEVARQLIAAGERPRLVVRNRDRARHFEGNAEIVEGDMDRPDSLAPALRDVDRMFLVSPPSPAGPAQEAGAIRAAKSAGVKHIVKLSVIGAEAPVLTFSKWHAESEKHLMDSGLKWTMLRPGGFTTTSLAWAPTIKSEGAFYQPTGEGRWTYIDPADIGAVAVKVLTGPGHEGKGYTLTGPEALTGAQYAEIWSAILRKPVKYVDVPPEPVRDVLLKTGMPPVYADAILDLFSAMKAGRAQGVTDTVERITGRKAASYESWARRNAGAFE